MDKRYPERVEKWLQEVLKKKKVFVCARCVLQSLTGGEKNIKRCVFMPACVCAAETGRKKKGTKQEREWEAENKRERLSGTKTTLAETA